MTSGEKPAGRRTAAFIYCITAYTAAAAAAVVTAGIFSGHHPLAVAALADLTATCTVFLFSIFADNSSIYDPYWSVAPVPIAVYFVSAAPYGLSAGKAIILLAVFAWSLRLTWNWASQWRGFRHEDWRYLHFKETCGKWYWPVSFFGIHLMPTLCVFLGCLSLYPALTAENIRLGPIFFTAAFVTFAAILIETKADTALRRFASTRKNREDILSSGLWAVSRHPNYFGEVLFWWGLFLFSRAAAPEIIWPVSGPLVITSLFLFVSIPLTEKRLLERHPGYADIIAKIPPLFPWFPRKEEADGE